MHFDVDLLPGGRVLITSHPAGDDERTHYRQAFERGSHHRFCGMSMDEIAGLESFETSNDGGGEIISKTLRESAVTTQTDLPSWVRKRT